MTIYVKPLLDFIARYESENAAEVQGVSSGYDVVVWQAFKLYPLMQPLTSLTVAEVLNWQSTVIERYRKKYRQKGGYSAVGRYQIIHSTLCSLIDSDWKTTELFNVETQDLLGLQLLQWRGLNRWLSGKITNDAFADALSMEWASLPYRTGRSYYDNDVHGNRSLASREELLTVLQEIKQQVTNL